MMKQLSDLRIVYPASPDKRTDYIFRSRSTRNRSRTPRSFPWR